jgi:Zn-dependent protease with chaperone function
MPFLLLLLLAVVLVSDKWWLPIWGEGQLPSVLWLSVATWTGVALVAAAAWIIAWRTCRRLDRLPFQRERTLESYSALRMYHIFALFTVYGAALALGWGWAVKDICTPSTPWTTMYPGAELLTLAPFLSALVLSWAFFYNAERALHATGPDMFKPFWSRRVFLTFHLRQNLALVVAPLGLMIALKGVQRLLPEDDGLTIAVTIGLVVVVFLSLPWILRLVLGLKPLPEGPLRTRLMGTARRLSFRFTDILVWNTHGGVVNAMVAGLLRYPRYVLLTDRLVTELTPDEVEAVFGHEVGHIKHYHMPYYAGFLIASMSALVWVCSQVLESFPEVNEFWTTLPMVAALGTYIFVVFGFLSRRCERQADVFGCRTVSCASTNCSGHDFQTQLLPDGHGLCATGIRIFIEALEKVARLNGISRHRPGWLQSWQHSTIARRVEFLQQVLADSRVESRFQRRVSRVKWGLGIALAATFLVLYGFHWKWWESLRDLMLAQVSTVLGF